MEENAGKPELKKGFSASDLRSSLATHISEGVTSRGVSTVFDKLSRRFVKTRNEVDGVSRREEALEHARMFVSRERFKLRYGKPWEDEHGLRIWGIVRTVVGKIFLSYYFEMTMVCVIFCNLFVIIHETNLEAKCFPEYKDSLRDCPHQLPKWVNYLFLSIYTIEVVVRIFVERSLYFKQKENILDFAICFSGLCALFLSSLINVSWLRILRICRLLRVFDIIATIPELRMLCVGFAGSMRAIFFGTILILSMLLFASIILVQFIHPINVEIVYGDWCERCHRGFASVHDSMLTLYQQIVAGDSWGLVNIPVIEQSPWVGILLCGVQLVVGVGAMNLILAVVVDRAVEAREANKDRIVSMKMKEEMSRKIDLLQLIAELDQDSSGYVSKTEVSRGIEEDYAFQKVLMLADVDTEELMAAFDFMPKSDTGEVSYLQLCDVLDEFQAADVRKLNVLIKYHLQSIAGKMDTTLHKLGCQAGTLQTHTAALNSIDKRLSLLTELCSSNGSSASAKVEVQAPLTPHLYSPIHYASPIPASDGDTDSCNGCTAAASNGTFPVGDADFAFLKRLEIAWGNALRQAEDDVIALETKLDSAVAGNESNQCDKPNQCSDPLSSEEQAGRSDLRAAEDTRIRELFRSCIAKLKSAAEEARQTLLLDIASSLREQGGCTRVDAPRVPDAPIETYLGNRRKRPITPKGASEPGQPPKKAD